MAEPLDLSIAIMCRDSEATIRRTLESVAPLAREIVAVDSGSTDRTMGVLREFDARIEQRPWQGYIGTCQIALELCTSRWVLAIDTDESVEDDLAASIRRALSDPDSQIAGYRMNRKVWYRGRFLDHAWQPEWRLRLVRRDLIPDRLRSMGEEPHHRLDLVKPDPGLQIQDLEGTLCHDTIRDLATFLRGQIRLGEQGAQTLAARGARPNPMRVLTSPAGAMLKQLVIKRAWRDGWRGWVAAGSSGLSTLAKHMILLDLASKGRARESGDRAEYDPPACSSPNLVAAHSDAAPPPAKPTQADGAAMSHSPTDDATNRDISADSIQSGNQPGVGDESQGGAESGEESPKKKRRRRRRRGTESSGPETGDQDISADANDDENDGDSKARRRTKSPVVEVANDPELFALDRTFADLGLNEALVKAIADMGFKHPTHIQDQLIPPAVEGKDILGQAKTGTGKTAAFGLPVLHLAEVGRPFQALILSPTRELAIQIRDEMRVLARHTGLKITAIYGGQRMQAQIRELEQGPEIIVGTPGRVMDMIGRGYLRIDDLRFAVLDEVDRMLDIGFREDIRKILRQSPKDRQTIVVSATIGPDIEDLARRQMNNPEKIVTASGSMTVKLVQQHYLTVDGWNKKGLLHHLLTHEEPALTLVFCRLKRTVDELDAYLRRHGIESHAIHGDLRQTQRDRVIKELRAGSLEVLIASDLAARGLDVVGITHVINFDLPEDPDLYVHRIGRTARAGRGGVAWSFVTPQQGKLLTHIELLIDAQIDHLEYPEFESKERPDNWRDDSPTRPIAKVDAPPPVNRMAAPDLPRSVPKSDREKKKLEAQFPGGIVPTKLPAKRMHGKLSTGRGKR